LHQKTENWLYAIIIFIAEAVSFAKNHSRITFIALASLLAALCIHRGFAGGQNSVLLGWIGLTAGIAAVAMFVVWVESHGSTPVIETTDHKNPAPEPDIWANFV
jgi:hypothetical protein